MHTTTHHVGPYRCASCWAHGDADRIKSFRTSIAFDRHPCDPARFDAPTIGAGSAVNLCQTCHDMGPQYLTALD